MKPKECINYTKCVKCEKCIKCGKRLTKSQFRHGKGLCQLCIDKL